MSATTPPMPKRRLPASPSLSPSFFQPKPSNMAQPSIVSSLHSRTPSRANAATPRAQSPQESYFNLPPLGYPSPKSMSPTSPPTRPIGSFSPHLRHLSPAPSSGVSSVRSMSEAESSDEEIFSPINQNQKVYLPDPDSDSESEDAKNRDIEIDLDPSFIPIDLKSEIASVFSEQVSGIAQNHQHKSSIISIEELPALPISPALSRTTSSGSSGSTATTRVSWQDSGIEIIQGEYSSCASDSELDTTDDPQTEDDEVDEFEWNVDVCSSSYPTDDFLLGGILGLNTGGPTGMGGAYTYNINNRSATPFSPRKRGYSTPSLVDNLEKKNNTIKRRSLGSANTKKRRIYSLFHDDGEGDDESDGAESPAKRVKGRMTIDAVLNGSIKAQNKGSVRRGSLSQMFGVTMAEDMDVDF
ncbi:hypothetical protein ABW19_dt0202781 [Dactylella cylindrospora]|nr:hypothetical protein ABW19_dt0202781 [Dactylella cylindrospora]